MTSSGKNRSNCSLTKQKYSNKPNNTSNIFFKPKIKPHKDPLYIMPAMQQMNLNSHLSFPYIPNMQSLIPLQMLSLLLLLLHPHHVASTNPLFTSCSTSNNYTTRDFRNNLNHLMSTLTKQAPPIGFGLSSIGQGDNTVHGLALCRGDVKISACRSCIRTATEKIHKLCSSKKEALVSSNHCLFRYSDAKFFGEIDTEHEFYECNSHNAMMGLSKFSLSVMKMMNELNRKAYLSPLLFSSGVVEIGLKQKMYGLAQCSRDLSGGDCNRCLATAIGRVLDSCEGRRGGRVLTGSCNIRYELEPFFDVEDVLHGQY